MSTGPETLPLEIVTFNDNIHFVTFSNRNYLISAFSVMY